jgi:hypothetical protein
LVAFSVSMRRSLIIINRKFRSEILLITMNLMII